MARLIGLKRISRVGAREKNGEGFQSEPEQVDTCEGYARALGDEIVLWIDETDSVSGKTMDREGVQEALRLILEDGFADVLIVAKYDRFSREMIQGLLAVESLRKADKIFIAVKDNVDSRDNSFTTTLVLTIFALMAAWYLDNVTKGWAAVTERRVKAGINTTEPYGYRKDRRVDENGVQVGTRKLVPVEGEAEWVRFMFEYRKNGMSWQDIADSLNQRGVRTRAGKLWGFRSVRNIVGNRTYLGEVRSGDHEPNANAHEAIVGLALFAEANAHAQANPNGEAMDYPLTGILRCSTCGVGMVGKANKKRNAAGEVRVYRYYDCRRKQNGFNGCSKPMRVKADVVEALVYEAFEDRFLNSGCDVVIEGVVTGIDLEGAQLALDDAEADLRDFINSPTTAELRRQLGGSFVDDGIATRMERVVTARAAVTEARNAMRGVDLPENLADDWHKLSPAERHEFLEASFEVIAAFPDNQICYWTVNEPGCPENLPGRGSGVALPTVIPMRDAPARPRVLASQ